jgi:hypothetical protein
MARGGRYPTPDEVVAKYKRGVDYSKDKWAEEAKSAADKSLFVWYSAFAAKVYDLVSGLPAKTGNLEEDVKNRVIPIANAIHELSQRYRTARARAIKEKAEESKKRAEAILGVKVE